MILFICGIKKKKGTNELSYKTEESHRCRKQTWLPGNKRGRDKLEDWD